MVDLKSDAGPTGCPLFGVLKWIPSHNFLVVATEYMFLLWNRCVLLWWFDSQQFWLWEQNTCFCRDGLIENSFGCGSSTCVLVLAVAFGFSGSIDRSFACGSRTCFCRGGIKSIFTGV